LEAPVQTANEIEKNQIKPLIIVVDDEEDILENYKDLLLENYRVQSYQDPRAFLSEMDKSDFQAPDLVVTDLKMPSIDGLEMIRRAQKKGHYFPFILLSGFLNKKSAIEAVETGVYRLLEKPVEFATLTATIEQLLLEHEVRKVRTEIRAITSQLRELYSGIRLALSQYLPEDLIDRTIVEATPDGSIKTQMSFDQLLENLESRLDSEKILNELRYNKMRL
jgi:FixJ family two-component response regulator